MIKKYLFRILILVLLSTVFVACKNGNKSMFLQENGIQFDTVAYKKTHFLNNNTGNPSCNLNIRFIYPEKSSKADLKKLQQLFVVKFFGSRYDSLRPHEALEKYTHDYIDSYINEAKDFKNQIVELKEFEKVAPPENPITASDALDDADDENNPQQFYSYHESLSDSITYNENGILSFQVNQTTKKGRNTTFESFYNYVVNLKTGKLITENDIFSAGYDVALQKIITAALLSQNNVRSVSELEDLGFFGIEEILPNGNFFVNEKGITYTFNKGEYSAYQLDPPTVFLSYDVLKPILRSNTVVSNLTE